MTAGAERSVSGTSMGTERSVDAGHELLVRLAGRLPDDLLWRLRDWLAAGAHDSIDAVLPRALLRHRLGVTEHERELLARCVDERSPSRRLVDAVLPLPELDAPATTFTAGPDLPDLAALSAMSVVAGHPGTGELRQSLRGVREDVPRHEPGPRDGGRRVLLVLGAERPWALTGTLQRLLRVHGDRTPCVEVIPAGLELPGYHQAAFVGSAPLWAAPADAAAASSALVAAPATGTPSGALTGT